MRAEGEVRAVALLEVLGCARDLVFSVGEIAFGVGQGLLRVSDGFRLDIRSRRRGRENAQPQRKEKDLTSTQGRMG
jgi:hypothetical protein